VAGLPPFMPRRRVGSGSDYERGESPTMMGAHLFTLAGDWVRLCPVDGCPLVVAVPLTGRNVQHSGRSHDGAGVSVALPSEFDADAIAALRRTGPV
jgi:hypothetical protein